MKLNEVFPSKWLKAEDFSEGEIRTVTIKGVTLEEFKANGKTEMKPVMEFTNEKPMVLNKTNAGIIEKLYGDDTDEWLAKKIDLFTMEVESFGDIVAAIRVKNRVPASTKSTITDSVTPISQQQKTQLVNQAQLTYGDEWQGKVKPMLKGKALADLSGDEAAKIISDLRDTPVQAPVMAGGAAEDESDPFADE